MKSAVINKETNVVENIIMADPSDPWPFSNTFLVLIPDNLPVNINDTFIAPYFINKDSIIMSVEDTVNGS